MWGENASSSITSFILSSGGSNASMSGTTGSLQVSIPIDILSGDYLRIRDGTNADYAQWSHDGTDFSLALTNTGDYVVSGLSGHFVVTGADVSIDNDKDYLCTDNAGTATYALISGNASDEVVIDPGSGGTNITGQVGFQGTANIAKPTITGSTAGNAALHNLLTQLAAYGLITDSTT